MEQSSREDVIRKHERLLDGESRSTKRATAADLAALGITVEHVPKES